MAIFVPGLRDKHNRPKNNGKREVVAHLSLTAMVDMFTVLVVFLLQNYNTQAIQIQQKVELPEAQAIKKLQPANVVVIGDREILVNDKKVEILSSVQDQEAWLVESLYANLQILFSEGEQSLEEDFRRRLQQTVTDEALFEEEMAAKKKDLRRITVQAGKKLDFLTVKKILYTVTEAGASEVNFAVERSEDK